MSSSSDSSRTRRALPAYLGHLLRLAGTELLLFEPLALEAIHQATTGLPRRMDLLAHHALIVAAQATAQTVTAEHRPGSSAGDHVIACGVWLGAAGAASLPSWPLGRRGLRAGRRGPGD